MKEMRTYEPPPIIGQSSMMPNKKPQLIGLVRRLPFCATIEPVGSNVPCMSVAAWMMSLLLRPSDAEKVLQNPTGDYPSRCSGGDCPLCPSVSGGGSCT